MEEQNGEPYKSIESFLIGNAQEISELKIELLKLHFQEIVKLAENLDLSKLSDIIPEGKKRGDKLIALLQNFKKNDGELYEYDAEIFDNDDTEIEEIRTKNLLFSIVKSLYLILCNSKERGELEVLRNKLQNFKFQNNEEIDKYLKMYQGNVKMLDYFNKFFPNNKLQPNLEEEQKVEPLQKKGVFSRFSGLFGSNKKSGAIDIEGSFNKIDTEIKKQKTEYEQVDKKEGEEDNINAKITAVETKFEELRKVKEKIDKLNEKINDKEIVEKAKKEREELKKASAERIKQSQNRQDTFFNANSTALRSFNSLEKTKEKDKDTDGFKELYNKNKPIKDEYDRIKIDTDAEIEYANKAIAATDKEIADLKKNPNNNKKKLIKEAKEEKDNAEEEFKELEDTLNTEISGIQAEIDKLKNNKGSTGGGKRIKYKSTSDEVVILYKNRESKKTVYIKEKTATKYCKINNKYILLSKLNVIG